MSTPGYSNEICVNKWAEIKDLFRPVPLKKKAQQSHKRTRSREMSCDVDAPGLQRMELTIELPTGDEATILGNEKVTIRDLKQICELKFGIPSNLQTFIMGESELQEMQRLEEQSVGVIKLQVPAWWRKIVCAALRRELENVSRRVKLPMQQITEQERCFVFLFIGCCLGDEEMTSRALLLDVKIDYGNTRTAAGRTLLHAAAAGGNIKCVDILMKNWTEFIPELFNARDFEKESPYDIAKRLGHQTMETLLYSYTNNDRQRQDQHAAVGEEERKVGSDGEEVHCHKVSCKTQGSIKQIAPEAPYQLGTPDESLGQNKPGDDEFLPSDETSEKVRTPRSQFVANSSDRARTIATESKTLQPASHATRQSLLHRRTGWSHTLPNFVFIEQEEEEEQEEQLTYLPPVQETDLVTRQNNSGIFRSSWRRAATRSASSPGDTRSAPTSPQTRRAAGLPTAMMTPSFPLSAPNSPQCRAKSRRSSEPFAPAPLLGNSAGATGLRRNSHQMLTFSPKQPRDRRKARSICEVTLNDALYEQWSVENDERLERPWNAWIAARRKDSLQPNVVSPSSEGLSPQKASNSRRMSFDQWLSEKDLERLRQMYAMLSLESTQENSKQNKQCKGKSFEEWMNDKMKEIEKEKQREKEGEEEQKAEDVQRDRRRRMSQQRYERWLMQKDQKALDDDEQQLKQAKKQMILMRKRWQEEDEQRNKQPAQRTRSCPTKTSPRVARWRFSSLHTAHNEHAAS